MTQHELTQAKDPDLKASLQAIRRAAAQARKIAMQTDTGIVIVQDKKLIHISAEELKRAPQE